MQICHLIIRPIAHTSIPVHMKPLSHKFTYSAHNNMHKYHDANSLPTLRGLPHSVPTLPLLPLPTPTPTPPHSRPMHHATPHTPLYEWGTKKICAYLALYSSMVDQYFEIRGAGNTQDKLWPWSSFQSMARAKKTFATCVRKSTFCASSTTKTSFSCWILLRPKPSFV